MVTVSKSRLVGDLFARVDQLSSVLAARVQLDGRDHAGAGLQTTHLDQRVLAVRHRVRAEPRARHAGRHPPRAVATHVEALDRPEHRLGGGRGGRRRVVGGPANDVEATAERRRRVVRARLHHGRRRNPLPRRRDEPPDGGHGAGLQHAATHEDIVVERRHRAVLDRCREVGQLLPATLQRRVGLDRAEDRAETVAPSHDDHHFLGDGRRPRTQRRLAGRHHIEAARALGNKVMRQDGWLDVGGSDWWKSDMAEYGARGRPPAVGICCDPSDDRLEHALLHPYLDVVAGNVRLEPLRIQVQELVRFAGNRLEILQRKPVGLGHELATHVVVAERLDAEAVGRMKVWEQEPTASVDHLGVLEQRRSREQILRIVNCYLHTTHTDALVTNDKNVISKISYDLS